MSTSSIADLAIIIVNYNSQFWLKKTLTSLKKYYLDRTKLQVTVTIVDNNSSDESVKMVKRECKWATVIVSPTNCGFAAGNNIALKEVTARYTMLLNNDVQLTEDSNLDLLIKYMDKHPETAVISPKVFLTNGKLDQACHRGEPTPWASLCYFLKLDRVFPHTPTFSQYHLTYEDLNSTHLIDACTGAAMIVRTKAMRRVGLLDEQFFMYAEDLDWCKRFRDAGYTIVFYPEVTVIHHKHKSGIQSKSKTLASKTKIHFYDTMLQYYDKYYRSQYPEIYRLLLSGFLFIKKGGF